jgi:hypothetical protein
VLREPRSGAACQHQKRDGQPLDGGKQGEKLFRLAAVGQGHHQIAAHQHPDVTVNPFGGMQEQGGGARACQRRGELFTHEP